MTTQALLFAKSHEWIEAAGATRKVGITKFAQDQLGDIVYVELPEPGKVVAAGDEICVIESTKATASVYAPASGKVVEANAALGEQPQLLNEDPLGAGWIVKLAVAEDRGDLLDEAAYAAFCKEEEEKGH
jgi:glycine cleavage system H protein